jgi:AcrR family transcriptional regulator
MNDAHARKTRLDILAAAMSVFMQKGFDGTSMEEIAAASGVTKRTLYKHYAQKTDLFTDVVATGVDSIIRGLGQPQDYADVPNEAIALYAARFLELSACSYSIAFQRMVLASPVLSAAPMLHSRGLQPAYANLAQYLRAHFPALQSDETALLTAESLLEAAVGAERTAILFGGKPPLPSPPPATPGAACDMTRIRDKVGRLLAAV